jgi:hypothetical protein
MITLTVVTDTEEKIIGVKTFYCDAFDKAEVE